MKQTKFLIAALSMACLTSCQMYKHNLTTQSVAYQSVRPVNYKAEIPQDAKILCAYSFTNDGKIVVVVRNNTDEVMIIDQTKSFLVNSDGKSISYYDPTVRVSSETSSSSVTQGGTVNLGAVAGALGIGGKLGILAGGVNVGGSGTEGLSSTDTEYLADQPQISLGPKGRETMSKTFAIPKLGMSYISTSTAQNHTYTPSNSYCKFSVCISYSLDGGKSFDKIVTDFYVNSWIVCPVEKYGKVNDALRNMMISKPDCFNEPWWVLYFDDNLSTNGDMFNGVITDYK